MGPRSYSGGGGGKGGAARRTLVQPAFPPARLFPRRESFPKPFARLSKPVRRPQQPPRVTFQARVSPRGRAAGRRHRGHGCGCGCPGTPVPAHPGSIPGLPAEGRGGRESGRAPGLPPPGAHLAPGPPGGSRAGGGPEGPGARISRRSEAPAGGGGAGRARGGPLSASARPPVRRSPKDPLGTKRLFPTSLHAKGRTGPSGSPGSPGHTFGCREPRGTAGIATGTGRRG